MSGFELVEIYNELSNYVISVLRSHHHPNAAKLPELIGALVKLYQCIKEE